MHKPLTHAASALALVIALSSLPGCIAWEIRDEMRAANAHMNESNCRLGESTAELNEVSGRMALANERIERTQALVRELSTLLEQTNTALGQVQASLGTTRPMIDATNQRLDDLMVLRQMQQTLVNINKELVPLSRSMATLGSTASLLGLGGDVETDLPPLAPPVSAAAPGSETLAASEPGLSPPTSPTTARVQTDGAGTPADGAPGATIGASGPAAANAPSAAGSAARPPNLLTGTWILTYPTTETESGTNEKKSRGRGEPPATKPLPQVLVILSSGQYLQSGTGQAVATGTWKRETGSKLFTLTPDAPSAHVPPAPGQKSRERSETGGSTPAAQPSVTMEILNNTPRLLSVRVKDGVTDEIRVYTRP